MPRTDILGFEQAAAMSLNYALDSVEAEIHKELRSGAEITPGTLHRLLAVIKKQRVCDRRSDTISLN